MLLLLARRYPGPCIRAFLCTFAILVLSLPSVARRECRPHETIKPADQLPCLPVQSFEFEAFAEGVLTLNAGAHLDGPRLKVVDGLRRQRGSAFVGTPIQLTTDSLLTVHARFRLDEEALGAPEGLTFTLQTIGDRAIGRGGHGLGYRGIRPSVAIELDTRQGRFDRNDNHVGLDLHGRLRSLRDAAVDFPMADGQLHGLWVELDGPGRRLRVWIGQDPDVRPLDPTLELSRGGLGRELGAAVFAGFTAATSPGAGSAIVESWSLSVERGCPCFADGDCDDGIFCNGSETCSGDGRCAAGERPCDGGTCDEAEQSCPLDTGLFETGTVMVGEQAQSVLLEQRYVDPVVVATVHHAVGTLPVVARVGNVTEQSFTLRLQNPSGDPVIAESVSYLVVESGVWQVDGMRFEARHYESSVTDGRDRWVGNEQSYGQDYLEPVVVGQVMSDNDPRWSVFWARGLNREDPPSAERLITGKTVAEDTEIDRLPETVGYIVFETAHGELGGVECEFALGPDTVAGVDDVGAPFAYPFLAPFEVAPEVTVVSIAGIDGNGGGWAEPYGPIAADADQLYLAIDEDQIADAERRHATEQVGYAVCERAFSLSAR